MEACKFHFDSYYDNAFYSRVVGIALPELNALEGELLWGTEYKLFVSEADCAAWAARLQACCSGKDASEDCDKMVIPDEFKSPAEASEFQQANRMC